VAEGKVVGYEVITEVVMKSSVFWYIKATVNGLQGVISQKIEVFKR
jgi:hypothetical protein